MSEDFKCRQCGSEFFLKIYKYRWFKALEYHSVKCLLCGNFSDVGDLISSEKEKDEDSNESL